MDNRLCMNAVESEGSVEYVEFLGCIKMAALEPRGASHRITPSRFHSVMQSFYLSSAPPFCPRSLYGGSFNLPKHATLLYITI